MKSYGWYGAYNACIEGVLGFLQYENSVKKELEKNIHIEGINDIIMRYYDMNEEYEYCCGLKEAKTEAKQD